MAKVIQLKRKESSASRFDRLVRPHFDALYGAARRMTLSPHEAEDLVQEVCIRALENLDELEEIEYPRAWLLRVMYNRFVDDKRRSSRSPVDISPRGAESSEPDDFNSSVDQPDDLIDRHQQVERVLRAMHCLNADHCALVAMHDIEGLTIDELCQLTGMPAGTIKAQLHRTRKKLGQLLKNGAGTMPHLKIVGGKNEL